MPIRPASELANFVFASSRGRAWAVWRVSLVSAAHAASGFRGQKPPAALLLPYAVGLLAFLFSVAATTVHRYLTQHIPLFESFRTRADRDFDSDCRLSYRGLAAAWIESSALA